MTDELQTQEEGASPDEAQPIEEAKEIATQPSQAEINWKQANEVMRANQQRIDELERRLVEKERASADEQDEFENLDDEDYTQNKALKKLNKEIRELKKALGNQVVSTEQQKINQCEQQARNTHDDYDYVIENFAIPLIKNDPALAYKVQNSKNPAETAYKLGKLSDSYEETTMKQQTNSKSERILKNSSRPVSSNAVGSPLKSQADQFSKMSPQQIWEQSQKYARGA